MRIRYNKGWNRNKDFQAVTYKKGAVRLKGIVRRALSEFRVS